MNKTVFFFLIALMAGLNTYSQQMFLTSYTMDDGLSANRVYSITQDSCGFIWLGTDDGLSRFDGIRFKNYDFSRLIDETTSNSVRKIFIDSRKRMWIGLDNGIVIYNPYCDSFEAFNATTENGEKIETHVTDILEDRENNIWIATNGKGVFKYSLNTRKPLTTYRAETHGIVQNQIVSLCEDSKGNIWMGSYSNGISRYEKQTCQFTHYTTENSTLSDNAVQRILEDSHGNIWIGTFQQGIDRFDPERNSFTNYNDHSSNQWLYHIHDMLEYAPGMLLVASDNGANYFDTDSKKVIPANAPHLDLRFKSNKFIYSIFVDKEESLWLGSYFAGVEFVSIFQNNFKYYTCTDNEAGKVINSIIEDQEGNCYLGTDDDGIFRLDMGNKRITPFHTAKDIGSTYYCIHDLLIDEDKLYAATYERGLEVFNLKTGSRHTYMPSAQDSTSIPSSKLFKLYKASNGLIYIGTSNGLCSFNPATQRFHLVQRCNSKVQAIVEDHHGTIWAGSDSDGLIAYNIRTRQTVFYKKTSDKASLPQNSITTLAIDSRKRVWIGTRGQGICLYNRATDTFSRYSHLSLPNNMIASITPKGNLLWIATNKGLVACQPDQATVKTYSHSHGLLSEQFTPNAGWEHSDGSILLGTSNGLCIFQPQNLQENSTEVSIILTGISLFGQELQPSANSPLEQSTVYARELDLRYDENMIGFDFALLSYIAPQENRYQYLLEGVDKQWQHTQGSKTHISYSNLAPGQYVLHIRGNNSDKIPAQNEIRLPITIHPHFLLSGPAYAFYILLGLSMLFLLVRLYIKRSQREQQEHLARLSHEKEEELYHSKIEFFTNIAHEIRTPLSLIIGPLDHLMQTTDIHEKYGEYLSIIEQNYKRLYTLVNQLLDFRKVDTGSYKLNYQTHNLLKLIQEVCIIFEWSIKQQKLTVDTSGIPADVMISMDEEAFTKIISNLLSNAVKYAHKEIRISYQQTEGGYTITVTDDGPGIPDHEKNKIFDAFYQVKENKERNKKGVGIGLHMTYALVQLMGGHIAATDRKDGQRGTTIQVYLPAREKQPNKLPVSSIPVTAGEETMEEAHTSPTIQNVMIVDDNTEVLNFLSKVLGDTYRVVTAQSGEEALQLLEHNRTDILVSDVVMEGTDGFELCRQIKNDIRLSHIPVILLTAKTDTESKITGLDSGADAYIEKPFTPSHLLAQLRNLLKKKENIQKAYAHNPLTEMYNASQNKLDEEFIRQCTHIIQNNLDNGEFTINSLASELNMSRTTFFQKIKGITGMTPNDFIKVVRLKMAAKLLVEGKYRITEIGFLVGFSSSSYFAKCFHKQFGMLPTDFVKQLENSSDSLSTKAD